MDCGLASSVFLICVASVCSLEFEGVFKNANDVKKEYEELRTQLSSLKKTYDTESQLLSEQMKTKLDLLEKIVSWLDNIEKERSIIEIWIERHRRAQKIIFGEEKKAEIPL